MAFNGVGYYNYDKGEWYQVPYDTPLPEGIDVFQLQIVNNNLFMVGEQAGETNVGYAAYSPVLSSNGQLDKLNWTIIVWLFLLPFIISLLILMLLFHYYYHPHHHYYCQQYYYYFFYYYYFYYYYCMDGQS